MTTDQWPVVRWAEKQNKWKADARMKEGGGLKFFHTREEAEVWAREQRIRRRKLGDAEFASEFSGHRLESLNKKNDLWPVIRWEQRHQAWRVDCRTANGGFTKFFSIRKSGSKGQALDEAEGFAEAQRIKRQNEGDDAFDLSAAFRIDATAVRNMIAQSATPNLTLREMGDFWFKHHAAAVGTKTVREVIDELIKIKADSGRTEKYLVDLRTRTNVFAKTFGNEKIINLNQTQVDNWIMGLPVVASTKNGYRGIVSVLLNFAVRRKYLVEAPISEDSKSEVKRGKPAILTVEQCAAFLSACEDEMLPAIALAMFAGLRPESEVWRLDWNRIHFDREEIDIDPHATKNDASVRWVKMSKNLVQWLTPFRKASGPVGFTKSKYFRRLQATAERAGIKPWPHDALRHCFCSYHYAMYDNVGATMAQVGHTNPRTFFRHYRARVRKQDAERFFSIAPAPAGQEKIVSISAA